MNADPSGQRPLNDQEVQDDKYTYSCNCGWIDWRHARPLKAHRIIKAVERAVEAFKKRPDDGDQECPYYLIDKNEIGHVFRVPIPIIGGEKQTLPRDVRIRRGKVDETNKYQVAMGIFRWTEENFEGSFWSWASQIGDPASRVRFLFPKRQNSYWSEEDLPSDLIGFYAAVAFNDDPEFWNLGEEAQLNKLKAYFAPICNYPVDKQSRTSRSVAVYRDYGGYSGDWQQVTEWEQPRLRSSPCIDAACGSGRAWPAQLKTIQPINGEQWLSTVYDVDPFQYNPNATWVW